MIPNIGKNIKIPYILQLKLYLKVFIQTLDLPKKMEHEHEEQTRVHVMHF